MGQDNSGGRVPWFATTGYRPMRPTAPGLANEHAETAAVR